MRTTQLWNKLPADALETTSCRLSTFRKRIRKVIREVKWSEGKRSEVNRREVKIGEVKCRGESGSMTDIT
jgi:hypothetical protein